MNAIEFVRKHGTGAARDLANREKTSVGYLSVEHYGLGQDELKEIVAAFEIIGLFKNLRHALIECDTSDSAGHSQILVKIEGGVGYIDVLRVRKAIFLVEQCNAKS